MRARHARPTRLQDRIVGFFVVLLLAVQLVSFLFIRYAIERTAQGTMRDELRVGARVFTRLLEQNSRQLADATSVLTYDFGFREAIATRDRATILSTLRNHAARIKANGMAVIGLDGRVVADTIQEGMAGKPYPFPDLVARAADLGRTSGVRVVDGKAYQIIVVPVLAPLPIAWVSISFVIDDATARDLQRITTSDISFVQMAGGAPHILATTLPPLRRASFVPEAGRIIAIAHDGATVRLGDDDYEVLARPIDDTGSLPIHAILQRLSADGLIAYRALEVVLLIIASLSLAVMLVGARRITGRITRPVALLGAAAIEIERGNYSVRVASEASDEIGELGRAFDRMAAGLAERDNMRDVLGKVASNEVVTRLLEGGDIELGGEERDVTVMFTDIRNFTAIVEKLTPDQSLQLLNQFLTVISEVIEAHGGVVDKYIGDGVMALFGAPVTREDDAQRALSCALEIRRRVEALGPVLAARNLPHPQIGIGMNTSRVIAGNIGSPSRLNYTVLGDGVNLAARLEGLTKRYHVPIVVGYATREKARDIVCRELDKVRVRGKTVPERIFEPLAREGELTASQVVHLAQWHEALEMFRLRCWDAAAAAFKELATVPGYERITLLYLGYIRDLEANPPGEDWDAAFTLYEK
ncbi:MAG TPA: adenylate/guanylate cyclase domain-containing protein [Usitatibacter sp.]